MLSADSSLLPSNVQLDAILSYIIEILPKASSGWSDDTLHTLTNLRKLLETLKSVIKEKNSDELLQDTLWLMFVESKPRVPAANVEREGEFSMARRHIRTITTILLTNSDLRHAIRDLLSVGRQLLGSKKPKDGKFETPDPTPPNPTSPYSADLSDETPHVPGAWTYDTSDSDESDSDDNHPLDDLLIRMPKLKDFLRHFKAAMWVI
jgi:hypothetical protein